MKVLVIGAGLAGLSATNALLDAGATVVVVDAFPVPGGRTASFDVRTNVAGLVPGDVVEHGLHAWFQHYHALFALMDEAGVPRPPFAGEGVYFFHSERGHYEVEGGPLFWLVNSLGLPESLRGPRGPLLRAFGKLIGELGRRLGDPDDTDRESARSLLSRVGVAEPAVEYVFRPCLFSLTSLPLEELSALEFLRWMAGIIPDPRIRFFRGSTTAEMSAPITEHLRKRGADFRFGVEVTRLALGDDGRVRVSLARAPDRTGVRHVLVPGFSPAEPPKTDDFDAIVCTLPWERLLALSRNDPRLSEFDAFRSLRSLENVRPLTVRLWFERPIDGAAERYILSSSTVFDVLRPTAEPHRHDGGIFLVDALVENIESLGLGRMSERLIPDGPLSDEIVARVCTDLEGLYPGQVRGNAVRRRFLHTREGIVACRPGAWRHRAPQHVGLPNFVLAGDWTRHPWGVCMEGAVRSGQLAVRALLEGVNVEARPWAFRQVAYSVRSIWQRT